MSEQEPRRAFRAWMAAWSTHDFDALDRCWGDEVAYHSSSGSTTMTRAQMREQLAAHADAWVVTSMNVVDEVVAGDTLWAHVTIDRVSKMTGDPGSIEVLVKDRFVGGRIAERWMLAAPTRW